MFCCQDRVFVLLRVAIQQPWPFKTKRKQNMLRSSFPPRVPRRCCNESGAQAVQRTSTAHGHCQRQAVQVTSRNSITTFRLTLIKSTVNEQPDEVDCEKLVVSLLRNEQHVIGQVKLLVVCSIVVIRVCLVCCV